MEVWESAIFKHRCPSHRNTWISMLSIILSYYIVILYHLSVNEMFKFMPFLLVCNVTARIFFLRWSTQPWRMFRWAWNVVPSKYLENWICLPILRRLDVWDHEKSRFRSSRNWTTQCPKLTSLGWFGWQFGDSIFQAWILLRGGVNHFDPQPNGSCRWVHILTVAASIFQLLGGGSAWDCAETVGQPGEMMQFTFVDFAKLDFVEWKHCRASKMVRYFGLVFAINWGTLDIVWGAKSRIIHIRTYMYVIHK